MAEIKESGWELEIPKTNVSKSIFFFALFICYLLPFGLVIAGR